MNNQDFFLKDLKVGDTAYIVGVDISPFMIECSIEK